MDYAPQHIAAPDGTPLVVIAEAEYDRLIEAEHLALDRIDAERLPELIARAAAEGSVPGAVVTAELGGAHPVAAWRAYRGLTQAALAARAGLSAAAISRIEATAPGSGRVATRRALAAALGAPEWALAG